LEDPNVYTSAKFKMLPFTDLLQYINVAGVDTIFTVGGLKIKPSHLKKLNFCLHCFPSFFLACGTIFMDLQLGVFPNPAYYYKYFKMPLTCG
jgi:hypothetical protein